MPQRPRYKTWPPLIDRPVYADPLPLRSHYTLTTALAALIHNGSISEAEAANLWTGTDSPTRTEYDDGRPTPTDS